MSHQFPSKSKGNPYKTCRFLNILIKSASEVSLFLFWGVPAGGDPGKRGVPDFPPQACPSFFTIIFEKHFGLEQARECPTSSHRNLKKTLIKPCANLLLCCVRRHPRHFRFAVCVANPTKTRFLGLSGHREKTTFVPSGNPGSQFSCGIPRRPPFLLLLEIADFFGGKRS